MNQKKPKKKLPIARNEDVEFSQSLADEDDLKAQERAREADQRQINK
ncbi:YfhD family protein [Chengkuizengella sp. SCS-71B]